MKKFILSTLILFFSTAGFTADAAIDTKKSDLTNQAFELLVKNIDHIKLTGDVHPGEKLKPILDELGIFITSVLFSAMDNKPDEDYKGRIKHFTAECDQLAVGFATNKCQLIIQYTPLGETGITFYIGLDKDGKPESILENRAVISRGD